MEARDKRPSNPHEEKGRKRETKVRGTDPRHESFGSGAKSNMFEEHSFDLVLISCTLPRRRPELLERGEKYKNSS